MPISKQEVEKLAELAKLELSSEEAEKYRHQLDEVLDYFEKIKGLDLDNVTQSLSGVSAQDAANPRADEVYPFDDNLVDQAGNSKDGYIVSPGVLKK